MKYRKKPIALECNQWFKNGDHPKDHYPIGIKDPTATDLARYDDSTYEVLLEGIAQDMEKS